MTELLAQRKAKLQSSVWGRMKPMRTLKEEAPEILELSVKADIIATVFADIASLKDPTLTAREDIQAKAKSVIFLVDEMTETLKSLMTA